MNKSQVLICIIGIVLLCMSELFPPWKYIDSETSAERDAGYHYFKRPPAKGSEEELRKLFAIRSNDRFISDYVDLRMDEGRLKIQRLSVAFLTLGLLPVSAKYKSRWHWISGALLLSAGLLFLGVLVLRLVSLF